MLNKIFELKEHNRKTEWINSIEKEFQELEEESEAYMHLESLRVTLKKYQIGTKKGHNGIH